MSPTTRQHPSQLAPLEESNRYGGNRSGRYGRAASLLVVAVLALALFPALASPAQAVEAEISLPVVIRSEANFAATAPAVWNSTGPVTSAPASSASASAAPMLTEVPAANRAAVAAVDQSIPRAAVVTIAVLSALIVALLIAFVVWMRRRAHAEAADGEEHPDEAGPSNF